MNVEIKVERITYRDIDFLGSPDWWLEEKLKNRLSEGYSISRDVNLLAWVCERVINP